MSYGAAVNLAAGRLSVHYGQAYVLCGDCEVPDLEDAFRGQTNGLCGAAAPGALFLLVGLHTGTVGFVVQVLDAVPEAGQSWEDVVEVSFLVPDSPVALYEWGETAGYSLPLSPGSYRARYCARGMDAGHRQDTVLQDEDVVDEHLLQVWPAVPGGDQVIRETSEIARYWHNFARELDLAGSPRESSTRSDNAPDAGRQT